MKSNRKKTPKMTLSVDGLAVDSFPVMQDLEIPQFGAITVSDCTRCPSHPESLCPCCTGPYLCP